MASKEDQGQALQKSAENYWLQCIKVWYPELHRQTYFLPPLHFNRVPYSVENIAGEQVLVAQMPRDGPSQIPSTAKSRSRKWKYQMSSSVPNLSGPVGNRSPVNLLLQPVYDKDVRDDKALERVLHCLRALADNSQQKEVMMVISQLQFGKYLGQPSYAAAAALLPRPSTLSKHFRKQHYHEGDFDVLIIHREHGFITLQIKPVGANFSHLKMTEQQEDDVVMKKVKEALKQLSKSEVVLKHLTSDLMDNNITKILAMPNIISTQLLRAISRNPSDVEDLCQCLGVRSVDDALKMCLLSDQLSGKRTASDVNHIVLKDLCVWWQQLVKMSGAQPSITETVYEHLVARFCGPATTVEVHCITVPRLEIRILGEAVSATGETMARLVLFPQQVELLNRSPPAVFLTGPPGTGKTIVLILQGITWIQLGHDVHVVSTWSGSRAATIAIEHQLKETTKTTTAHSRVYRHQFDFYKDGEVENAVRCLKSLREGRQLCVIADEAIHDYSNRKYFTKFCDELIVQVPVVYLWGASVYHEDRPLCLEEVKLTTPLRSPPIVVREVMEAEEIKISKQVHDYTVSDVPVPTDGPAVIRFTHRDGQSGHTKFWPHDCVECGLQVARVLTELNVGRTGNSNGPPPLQYRDVLVLCNDSPTDDRVDNNGQVTTTASGLVRGLRACHVPVRVVESDDEAAICDTALGVGDLVTVTNWRDVRGLERKVVVVENRGRVWQERLFAMSRSTSQLVFIDCLEDGLFPILDTKDHVCVPESGSEAKSDLFQYDLLTVIDTKDHISVPESDSESAPSCSKNNSTITNDKMVNCQSNYDEVSPPFFSEIWQMSSQFSSAGGQLQGKDSDVVLYVPENAIALSINVTIFGAVSTDLETVHERLDLEEHETIVSPVVEYCSRECVVYQKALWVILPYFMTPLFSPDCVRVYQFQKNDRGQPVKRRLYLKSSRDLQDPKMDTDHNDYFFIMENKRICVVVSHFSGFVCVQCERVLEPFQLELSVYGIHRQRDKREVEISLCVWDGRLQIKDFEKDVLSGQGKDLKKIRDAQLDPPTPNDQSIFLGMRMVLGKESEATWKHLEMGGEQVFPVASSKNLNQLYVQSDCRNHFINQQNAPCPFCFYKQKPIRNDWALEENFENMPSSWFYCAIRVGYTNEGPNAPTMQLLEHLPRQTLLVNGLPLETRISAGSQTDNECMNRTYVDKVSDISSIHQTELSLNNVTVTSPERQSTRKPQKFVLNINQVGKLDISNKTVKNVEATNEQFSIAQSISSLARPSESTHISNILALPTCSADDDQSQSAGTSLLQHPGQLDARQQSLRDVDVYNNVNDDQSQSAGTQSLLQHPGQLDPRQQSSRDVETLNNIVLAEGNS